MLGTFDRDFTRNFFISLGIHGGLLLFVIFGGKLVMDAFKDDSVEIVRSSVRVDVVGMPKFTIQELRELQKNAGQAEPEVVQGNKEEVKVKEDDTPDVIKPEDLVIKEEGKEKKSSFLNILSDYSNKKIEKKEKPKGRKEGMGDKEINSLIVEGNRLSKGSALVGDFSDEAGSEFGAYVQMLPDAIRRFWKLPTHLLEKDLRCRIKIFLSTTGQLVKLEVQESSGEEDFDARAEKAIRDAAPFPAPTEVVGKRLVSSGIILGFPL